MKTILSTKKLSFSQREHLLNAGLSVVDYNFIKTEEIAFELPNMVENAVFSSQNGVNAVLSKNIKIENAYCVGRRTEKLVLGEGITIQYVGENAKELGEFIIKKASDKIFHYFCAKDRLDILPNALLGENIQLIEIPVYKTTYTSKEYKQIFDGVLFFSPSGVESFFRVNKEPEHSFCIGNTTAKTLKKYTKHYTVASQTTVENVLIKAIKHFKND